MRDINGRIGWWQLNLQPIYILQFLLMTRYNYHLKLCLIYWSYMTVSTDETIEVCL